MVRYICMAKRGTPVKHITVSLPVHERFMAYRKYGESTEGILIKIMDDADKYKLFSDHHKKRGQTDDK